MGRQRRRWNHTFRRGTAVDHPSVHALLSQGDPGTRPLVHIIGGTSLVTYSATRVHMKREAWELLPPDGILVEWIRPEGETPWALAMTHTELHAVFGEVQESISWQQKHCYHFPKAPYASQFFRVSLRRFAATKVSLARTTIRRRQGHLQASSLGYAPSHAQNTGTPPPSASATTAEVLDLLRRHGTLSEVELTRLAGSARTYRRLRGEVQALAAAQGDALIVEATAGGAVWRLRGTS